MPNQMDTSFSSTARGFGAEPIFSLASATCFSLIGANSLPRLPRYFALAQREGYFGSDWKQRLFSRLGGAESP